MLPQEKIDALITLLERMAQDRYARAKTMSASPQMRAFERWSLGVYVAILLLIAVLGGLYRYGIGDSETIYAIVFYLSAALNVSVPLCLGVYVFRSGRILWREKKRIVAGALEVSSQDALRDASYVQELCTYSKAQLEYAFVHCRHAWGMAEGRAALLNGDLRKLGLLPAVLATLAAVPKLLDSASNPLFWASSIGIGAIYLMTFYVFGSSERRTHVLGLLQYAIDHTEEIE